MAISNDIDRWLQRESPANLLAISWILGALILFCASFVHVEEYTAPVHDVHGLTIQKQFGLWWAGLNWVIEFLVVLPTLLFILSHMASTVRIVVGKLTTISSISTGESEPVDLPSVSIDERLAKFKYAIYALFFALLVTIFKIWLSACGYDLINNDIGSDLVFWGNGVIPAHYNNVSLVLIYTAVVYVWLFITIFVYLLSLLITIVYSIHVGSILSSPKMSIPRQGGAEKSYLVQVANVLKSFTVQVASIYMLGLITTFVLNFQLAYLESSASTMGEFILSYIDVYSKIKSFNISRILVNAPTVSGLSNDELWFPALLLFSFTLLSLIGSTYHLWVGLSDFNQKFAKNTPIKIAKVFHGFRANLTLAIMLSICSFFPNLGLIVISAILGRTVVFVINKARNYRLIVE